MMKLDFPSFLEYISDDDLSYKLFDHVCTIFMENKGVIFGGVFRQYFQGKSFRWKNHDIDIVFNNNNKVLSILENNSKIKKLGFTMNIYKTRSRDGLSTCNTIIFSNRFKNYHFDISLVDNIFKYLSFKNSYPINSFCYDFKEIWYAKNCGNKTQEIMNNAIEYIKMKRIYVTKDTTTEIKRLEKMLREGFTFLTNKGYEVSYLLTTIYGYYRAYNPKIIHVASYICNNMVVNMILNKKISIIPPYYHIYHNLLMVYSFFKYAIFEKLLNIMPSDFIDKFPNWKADVIDYLLCRCETTRNINKHILYMKKIIRRIRYDGKDNDLLSCLI